MEKNLMAPVHSTSSSTALPPGFQPVAIETDSGGSALRIGALVRTAPDPVTGSLVSLREMEDAAVYLGCVMDAQNRLQEWVELWVQKPDNVAGCPSGYRERLSNDLLDQKWIRQAEGIQKLSPGDCIVTGWESTHPTPTLLDPAQGKAVTPTDPESGQPLRLCRDDDALTAAGLPSYTHSLFRYLVPAGEGKPTKFFALTNEAPTNEATQPLTSAGASGAGFIPFNLQAGLLQVRRLAPVPVDAYADVLSGKPWTGLGQGKTAFPLGSVYTALQDKTPLEEAGAYLFTGPQGLPSRLAEAFHLKLQLLTDVIRLVRDFVGHEQLPFLNLSPDSFAVKLSSPGAGLPYLWTAAAALIKPSQAVALPVEAGEFRYFMPGKTPHPFIYLPEGVGQTVRGQGSVRIRETKPADQGRFVVEGTLISQEEITISPHDLLWFGVPLGGAPLNLYGHLYAEDGMAQGEARFRTLPLAFPESARNALNAAAGTALSRIPFEVVPLLSTPCDLYSLGVLAVKLLLVNEENTLPIALDEILSLARQMGSTAKGETALKDRIRELFDQDTRWHKSLGPHRLRHSASDPAEIARVFPMELWFDVLAALVRFFPGLSPHSVCKDYGDAPALALETVFNPPLRDLEALLRRTRSLIVIDWTYNREVHSVIKRFIAATDAGNT